MDSWYENWSEGHELGEEEPRVSDAELDDIDDICDEVEAAKQSLQELLQQSSVVQPETVMNGDYNQIGVGFRNACCMMCMIETEIGGSGENGLFYCASCWEAWKLPKRESPEQLQWCPLVTCLGGGGTLWCPQYCR